MKKHYSLLLAFLVAFSSFFVSCDENDDFEDLYKCKITVTCTEGGKVKISKYLETTEVVFIGSEIEVVATPNEGYAFAGWYLGYSIEPVSNDSVFTFVATKNTMLTAHFTKLSNLTICSAGNGRVSFKDMNGTSGIALNGSEVTVIATPDENCDFIGWFVGEEEIPISTDAEYTFIVKDNITLTAKFSKRPKTYINGYEYIDLGLPSGLKWATCNVGATSPEEYGGYYAWGEIEEKGDYSWSTYKWCNGSSNSMTKYCTSSSYGTIDNKTTLDPEDDVAHIKWGGTWRMPTLNEQEELINNCTWSWTTQNGVNCYKVTGSNGNSIFLPAAGYCHGSEVYDRGSIGYYWSSLICGGNSANALDFSDGNCFGCFFCDQRYLGQSVRPVSE
jgi:hypothetical protein